VVNNILCQTPTNPVDYRTAWFHKTTSFLPCEIS